MFLDIYRCQTDYAVDENVSKGQHCWRKGAKRTTLLTKRCQTDNTADENVSNGLHSWRECVKRATQLTRRCQTDNTADEKVSNGQHSWRDGSKSGVTSGTVTACPYRAFMWVLTDRCLVFYVVFCRSLFALFFFWSFCYLTFDLRILITILVFSNLSWSLHIAWVWRNTLKH